MTKFSPVENLYIIAANSLGRKDRIDALWDIAEITGRPIWAVQRRAVELKTIDKKLARAFLEVSRRKEWAPSRHIMVAGCKPGPRPALRYAAFYPQDTQSEAACHAAE